MSRTRLAGEPKKILVRMPNWVGDLVMATPFLAALRERFPKAQVTAMCLEGVADALLHHPHVDELLVFSRSQRPRRVIRSMRRERYDLGLLLTNSFSSALWFWRGRVRHRIGYARDGRRALLSRALKAPVKDSKEHQVITYQRLLEPFGVSLAQRPLELYVREEERLAAVDLLRARGVPLDAKLLGINPGAAYGSAKCWLPERFRAVTERLLERTDTYILYFGDQKGAPLADRICEGLPERVINLAGATSLRELMALMSLCLGILTNDSGPMHIAAALKIPLLALFGSTSAVRTGPYQHGRVIHKGVECSPCYLKTCPIDFRCMKRITSDEVFEGVLSLLDGEGG